MHPKPTLWMATVVAVAFLSACGDNQDEPGSRELLAEVQAQEYRSWDRAPGFDSRTPSSAAHGNAVEIFVNDVVSEVLLTKRQLAEWPVGSVIVKDGFRGDELVLIAIMEKRADGWYYAEYDSAGSPDFSGRPDICVQCHARGSDYVLAFPLP